MDRTYGLGTAGFGASRPGNRTSGAGSGPLPSLGAGGGATRWSRPEPWLKMPEEMRIAAQQRNLQRGRLTSWQSAPGYGAGTALERSIYAPAQSAGSIPGLAEATRGLMYQRPLMPRPVLPRPTLRLRQESTDPDGRLKFSCELGDGRFTKLEAVISIREGDGAQRCTVRRRVQFNAVWQNQVCVFKIWIAGQSSVRLVGTCRGQEVRSNLVEITFNPEVQARDGGGPVRTLLNGRAVRVIPPERGGASWAADKMASAKKAELARDLVKLRKWLKDKVLPDDSAAAPTSRAAELQAEAEAQMHDAIDQAIREFGMLEAIVEHMPFIGQAVAAGQSVNELRKWVGAKWSVHKINDHRRMLDAAPPASGRRPTVHAALAGLEAYQTALGNCYLAKAGAKAAEVGGRLIPGASQIVGAVVNGGTVALHILKNNEEAGLATRTNKRLILSENAATSQLCYEIIRHDHVAVLCHVLTKYQVSQIVDFDNRSCLIVQSFVPIEGLFAKARDKIKNIGTPPDEQQILVQAKEAATALKARAKTVQDDLRYEVALRKTPAAPTGARPPGLRPRGRPSADPGPTR